VNTISSKQTYFSKRVFPALWLGGVALFLVNAFLMATFRKGSMDLMFVAVPVVMLVFGFFFFRKLLWDLADEVQDAGDYLLVRRGSIEQRVPLANIINVSVSQFSNPKRLTLRLRAPCQFGDEIAFIPKMPAFRLNPFARNAIGEDLIKRVDAARSEAAVA
jgi:hypothetical protein